MTRRKRAARPRLPGTPAPTPQQVVQRLYGQFPEDMALLARAEKEEGGGHGA